MNISDHLARARGHAAEARSRAKAALDAEVDGDSTDARRQLRAALAAHEKLRAAHDSIARALEGGYSEPTHSSPQGPSQTSDGHTQGASDGQAPRDYSPEAIRLRDQERACRFAYEARLRQMMGVRR